MPDTPKPKRENIAAIIINDVNLFKIISINVRQTSLDTCYREWLTAVQCLQNLVNPRQLHYHNRLSVDICATFFIYKNVGKIKKTLKT